MLPSLWLRMCFYIWNMLSFHFGPGREGRTSSNMQTQTSDSSQECTADDHNGEIYASIDESVIGNEDKVTADSATYQTGKHCVLWIVKLYIWGKKNNREYDIDRTFTGHAINFSGNWQYRSPFVQTSPTWISKWMSGSTLILKRFPYED